MCAIETTPNGPRLTSEVGLTADAFAKIAAHLKTTPFKARKTALITARQATSDEPVDSHWNGKETSNVAQPGDYVVTSLDKTGAPMIDGDGRENIYGITKDAIASLYEPAGSAPGGGILFRARATVSGIKLSGGFDIVAPWGEKQRADSGYLLQNGDDIYGNNVETFEASYERMS